MLTVLRREEKYPLKLQEAYFYIEQFSEILSRDPNSVNGSYKVRSLYFDTLDDRDFFEKMNEQNLRRKVRLRIYSPYDRKAKLELKQKENIFQKKRSLSITREDAEALISGDYSVLFHYKDDFAMEMFYIMSSQCYKPKSIVEYDRLAFMAKENNIRLTFDSNIRATECTSDLFSDHLNMYSVFDPNNVIFEVKYDKFMLGYISDIISTINRRKISSSKYCLSRSVGYPLYL